MRPIGACVLAAVVGAGLIACVPEPVAGWEPSRWPAAAKIVDAPPAAELEEAPMVGMRLRNDEVGVDARWAYLPGEHAFNTAVEDVVRAAVHAQAQSVAMTYRPVVHRAGAGLSERGCIPGSTSRPAAEILGDRIGTLIVCEIVLARGSVAGQRLRVITASADGVATDDSTTIYTDLATGEIATSASLFADAAELWPAFIEALRRDAGSLSTLPISPPGEAQSEAFRDVLDQSVIAGDEVVIPVPDEFTAAELDGLSSWGERQSDSPRYVALRAADHLTALTPVAQAISAAQGPFLGQPSLGAGFDRTPCDLVPCMALTLDDGPSSLTPGFLDVLRDKDSAATFYMLGQSAQAHPDIVRRVADEGHEIGNHTWSHPYLTELTDAQVRAQLDRTAELLRQLSGQQVNTFRPPGGFVNAAVVEAAGQPAIMWSIDTRDWAGPADGDLARHAIDAPNVSSILLMHDIQSGSARVFDQIVTGLRDRGFSLVTIDALFDGEVPAGIVRHGPLA